MTPRRSCGICTKLTRASQSAPSPAPQRPRRLAQTRHSPPLHTRAPYLPPPRPPLLLQTTVAALVPIITLVAIQTATAAVWAPGAAASMTGEGLNNSSMHVATPRYWGTTSSPLCSTASSPHSSRNARYVLLMNPSSSSSDSGGGSPPLALPAVPCQRGAITGGWPPEAV